MVASAGLRVVYRPPLPALTLTDPVADIALFEGKDDRAVAVRGDFARPDGLPRSDLQPFEVVLRVFNNGQLVPQDGDPVAMAKAFAMAIEAGRMAFEAKPMAPRDMAVPSTPTFGRAALGDRR